MLVSGYRVLKFAAQDFWRNIWLSFATILMLVLTLFAVNFLVALNKVAEVTINAIESRIDVSVYLKKDLTVDEIQKIKADLENVSSIAEVKTISADEALELFKSRHATDPEIIESLDELGENPLGPSLVIKADNAEDYPYILAELNSNRYNDFVEDKDFDDHQALIVKVSRAKDKATQAVGLLTVIFILVAALIVYNAIRVNIYTHRKELEVMKLVGATNWFIRAPFIVEAMLYALIALLLIILALYPLLNFIQPYLTGFFVGQQVDLIGYFMMHAWSIFGFQLLGLLLVNIVSTSLALGRYLKV